MIKISPSVLAGDLSCLADEVGRLAAAGADMMHLDVMDGIFVTNLSFGMPVIECLRKHTDAVLDVHLMIDRPERYVERFLAAGADILTFHYEACEDSAATLDLIRSKGRRAAISIKPKTAAEEIFPLLDRCDMVLVMTVEPGYGGQSLIPETMEKMRMLKGIISHRGKDILIEVDGGINEKTAKAARDAGADVLVAGSAIFGKPDYRAAIDALRG